MAKIKISAVSRKSMASQFGGTWELVKVKVDGHGDEIFELNGYGKQDKANVKAGSVITGYFSERSWNSKNGPVVSKTINKITPEYVYDLLLKKFPDIESPAESADNSIDFDSPAEKQDDGFNDPGF